VVSWLSRTIESNAPRPRRGRRHGVRRHGRGSGRAGGHACSSRQRQQRRHRDHHERRFLARHGGIEAHGAGLIRTDDAWYWIGEDKSHNSGNFKAVNCYRSTNLADWEFRHAIITRDTSTELDAADRINERPKVVYSDTTKKYVMWLHWEGDNYATAEAGVSTSDTVDGDYTQVRHFRPNNRMSRDDTLFKDDDGTAYFLSASNENADLSLYDLTDDYTNMKSQMLTLWPGSYREAPALMKANDRYFMGRYICFVGLSEVDGRAYTSIAELDVAGVGI
jgi:hypothetical protein